MIFSPRLLVASLLLPVWAVAANEPPPIKRGENGRLHYEADSRGLRVPDYSHAGYAGGGVALPHVPTRLRLAPVEGDDGVRLQTALDYVCSLKPDAQGWRGALELEAGTFDLAGQLQLSASGVVLRGAGAGKNGTRLLATGTDRRSLIRVAGFPAVPGGPALSVTTLQAPGGETRIQLSTTAGLQKGWLVHVVREATADWIKSVGMDWAPGRQPFQWRPGKVEVSWLRTLAAVDATSVTLDAPLPVPVDTRSGPLQLIALADDGLLRNVGIENLACESAFEAANPLDEQHAWNAVELDHLRDSWVSDVTARHFAGSAVLVGDGASRVTVQDVHSLEPVSELGGHRRQAFHIRGQQVLVFRCTSEQGRQDFVAGHGAAGPIAFVECQALESQGFSGSIAPWVTGLLYESVQLDGGTLRLDNLETYQQGTGWAASHSMLWGSSASVMICRQPPGDINWAVAVWGQFVGDGRWSMVTEFANPESLYRAQLADRLGPEAVEALTKRTYAQATAAPTFETVGLRLLTPPARPEKTLTLQDGLLRIAGQPLEGKDASVTWWKGRLERPRAAEIGPSLTRFAPGRTGTGLTDDLREVAEQMKAQGKVILRQHYGLWYDRRRDDHQMTRRVDAEVWPPFFEQPFARSGQGRAWDGLSRYDLTRYNPWYFGRLREFAREARHAGLVLLNEMYFQHNIIESGAHWVDCPWRPVNNINQTGFTEPPPFNGDTIKMANEFYDVTHPVRRELHRAYIRQCLANLAGETNVIHTLSAENSGPLHFMQFWIDVIAEWERETGQHPLIALSAPKDVQDAILADPARAAVIDVIDLTYWFRTAKGDEFAPPGGRQLAPRQDLRLWKGGRPNAATVRAMAAEYRTRHPGKAVITGLDEADSVQPR